ncbi:hypothetical protein [Yersinia artesiana]|uniref:hypothetical protein n=1 Tax=Yersinia artesiana TaxID=2890315 RepID=UPI001581B9ED|nr:hypothetical protein [Yersinia artesiana]UXD25340.1 hypothetical protein FORC065_2537 [Yersinia enterocolitica]
MGFSLFKLEIGDSVISKSIDAASQAWDNIDNKYPILGCVLVLSLPTIVLYFIYTWGRLRTKEKNFDKPSRKPNRYRKKATSKGGKK